MVRDMVPDDEKDPRDWFEGLQRVAQQGRHEPHVQEERANAQEYSLEMETNMQIVQPRDSFQFSQPSPHNAGTPIVINLHM